MCETQFKKKKNTIKNICHGTHTLPCLKHYTAVHVHSKEEAEALYPVDSYRAFTINHI